MRIIGHIEHPHLKITVFKTGERVSVKFENALYEETFKLGTDERVANLAGIEKWVDKAMIDGVLARFQQMHTARMEAFVRAFPAEMADFEEII